MHGAVEAPVLSVTPIYIIRLNLYSGFILFLFCFVFVFVLSVLLCIACMCTHNN